MNYRLNIRLIANEKFHAIALFNILIIISACAVIFSVFFLKETFCKSTVHFTFLTPKKDIIMSSDTVLKVKKIS